MTSIGENIKSARKNLGITQDELAEKLSVTRQAVSNWENGKTEPDIGTLASIADIFGTSTDALINKNPAEKAVSSKINSRLFLSVIFLALSIVFILILLSIKPIIATGETHLINKPSFMMRFFTPFCCITGIYGILLFISLFKDIIVKNVKVRKTFFIIGSVGIGIYLITGIIFLAYTIISDNLFYSYPYLFFLRSPKFIQIIFRIFEFLSKNILFSIILSALLFFGINKESKIDDFHSLDIKSVISCALLVFSVTSLLSFEILSPVLKAYVSSYYDYTVYYVIVGFWKPASIVLGTFGILDLIFKYLNFGIKNEIIRKIILVISVVLLSTIFISNFITFVLMLYVSESGNGISTNFMRPAFFMMQHQILYIIPSILLSFGLSKKYE